MTTTLTAPKGAKFRIAKIEPLATLSHETKCEPHVTVEDPTSPDDESNDPNVQSIEVEVVGADPAGSAPSDTEVSKKWAPMTAEELEQLKSCETILSKHTQAFIEVGRSLALIQAKGLYREKAATFTEYVEKYYHFTFQRAWQLIGASDFTTILSTRVDPAMLPTSERAVRELMKASDDKVVEVLEEARRDGEPTAERINAARLKISPPKAKDGKPKRIPPVKIEAAMKAGATWSRFLKECNPEQLDETQRTQVTAFQSEAATAFSKLSLAD